MTSRLKSFWSAFLGSPGWLLTVFLPLNSAVMLLDYRRRTLAGAEGGFTAGELGRILAANFHWVIAFTAMISFYYAMIIGFAFHRREGPEGWKPLARRWILLSCLAGILHLVHGNFILPRMNFEAAFLRKTVIYREQADRADRAKTDRELLPGELLAEIRKHKVEMDSIAGQDMLPERKARRIETREKWIRNLYWEMIKKFQMAAYVPLLALIAMAAGLQARRLRNGVIRFIAVYLFGKLTLWPFAKALLWTSNRIEAGGPLLIAWAEFSLVILLAAAAWSVPRPRLAAGAGASGAAPDP